MGSVAVHAIHVYRRHISPRKGFRCAHNVLHGTGSCSDYGLQIFDREPFMVALKMLRRRFAECRSAKDALVARTASVSHATADEDGESREKRERRGASNSASDAGWWYCDAANVGCTAADMCSAVDVCSCSL
jgi:putative component of membrane protein insertase Oxa1/YidC/SpoIIIJ protein YidD